MAFKQDELDQLQTLFDKQREDISEEFKEQKKDILQTVSEMFKQQRKDINNDIGEVMSKGFDAVGQEHGSLETRVKQIEDIHPGGRHTTPGAA